jgi:chemotaxis protein MotB
MNSRVPVSNPHAQRASGDRWLFGYADIVTLLLAVFASLYAASSTSSAEVPVLAAVSSEEVVSTTAPVIDDDLTVPLDATEVLALTLEDVVGDAASFPGVEMSTSTRGVVISLPEAGSFPAGSADLSVRAMGVMADLAARLRELPNQIRVEGHTDDIPIATAAFASNWELSTGRATRVVEFLIDEGIDPGRLAAAGYAEHRPRLANATPASRARNRRVDIVVLDPASATLEEPGVGER